MVASLCLVFVKAMELLILETVSNHTRDMKMTRSIEHDYWSYYGAEGTWGAGGQAEHEIVMCPCEKESQQAPGLLWKEC